MTGRAQPGVRGDVDDRAAAARPHRDQDELRSEHHGAQVQVERALPPRRARRREARFLDASGVVDQHADRPGRGDRRGDVSPVCDVGTEKRAADPFGRNRARLLVPVGDDHVHAFRGEPLRDPGAYPFRTSRHQSGRPVEFHDGSVRPGTDIHGAAAACARYLLPR
jgi:hypothetical protein